MTSVTVLVHGKRIRVLHGHLPRTIVISFKGRVVGAVTVVLHAKVLLGGRTTTHTEKRVFHPCVSGVGHPR